MKHNEMHQKPRLLNHIRMIATASALLWLVVLILGTPMITWTEATPRGEFLDLKLGTTLMTGLAVFGLYACLSWVKRLLVTPLVGIAIAAQLSIWIRLP